jgi:hypothetical protein
MKRALILSVLVALVGSAVGAQGGAFAPARFNLSLEAQPVGVFNYLTTDGPPVYSDFDYLVDLGAVFEYRLAATDVGVGGYFLLRSHRWSIIDSSYPLIARIMGAPAFALGAMAFWHLLPDSSAVDLCLGGGLGCNVYFADVDEVYAGIEIAVELAANWKLSRGLSLGPKISLSRTLHDTGGATLRDFEIRTADLGLAARWSFD